MTQLEIEAFLTIVRTGNISAAAQSLYVTQPALSRRIASLEKELGCTLFVRGKGIRSNELTAQGKYFLTIAEKWQNLYKETSQVVHMEYKEALKLSSVGSISTYLLPPILQSFMEKHKSIPLSFHSCHSNEGYSYIDSEKVDFALISDPAFYARVETKPLFRESMVLVGNPDLPECVHPSQLDVTREINLPWYPEYNTWHDYWFGTNLSCRVYLDQMPMMEAFLVDDCWAIMPLSVAHCLPIRENLIIHSLKDGPTDRVIYYLMKTSVKKHSINLFLEHLVSKLREMKDIQCLVPPASSD